MFATHLNMPFHFLNPNKINSDETTNQLKINTDGENSHYKIHTDEDNAIINSCTNTNVAMNPEMVTFSSFDGFGAKHESFLKSKQVLLYCTGGIRCEKASAMLRKRGIDDVKQLSGGIHRYMEKYPNGFLWIPIDPDGRGINDVPIEVSKD